jgi:hypothetical protein
MDREAAMDRLTRALGNDCKLKTRQEDYPDGAYPALVKGLKRRDQKSVAAALSEIYRVALRLNHGLVAPGDDLSRTIDDAVADIEEIVGEICPSLMVDVERMVAVFSQPGTTEEVFPLKDGLAAKWLAAMAERPGLPVTIDGLSAIDLDFLHVRPGRLLEKLPPKIRKWIVCQRGNGCRLALPNR